MVTIIAIVLVAVIVTVIAFAAILAFTIIAAFASTLAFATIFAAWLPPSLLPFSLLLQPVWFELFSGPLGPVCPWCALPLASVFPSSVDPCWT